MVLVRVRNVKRGWRSRRVKADKREARGEASNALYISVVNYTIKIVQFSITCDVVSTLLRVALYHSSSYILHMYVLFFFMKRILQ